MDSEGDSGEVERDKFQQYVVVPKRSYVPKKKAKGRKGKPPMPKVPLQAEVLNLDDALITP